MLICIAAPIIWVAMIASTMTIIVTAEADKQVLLATNKLLMIAQVQLMTLKLDLLQLGPHKIPAHTNSHNPLWALERMLHTFTTLLRTQETLELQR